MLRTDRPLTMLGVDYIPISVATLLPTEAVGLDLYQEEQETKRLVLYRAADYPLSFEDLERLRGRGIHRLFISKDSRAIYQRYLREIATNEELDAIPLAVRAGALTEVVRDVLQAAFAKGSLDQTIEAAAQLGTLTADILTKNSFAASDLFRVFIMTTRPSRIPRTSRFTADSWRPNLDSTAKRSSR